MAIVYIALGSNQGNRRKQLSSAIQQINKLPKTRVVKTSNWIETDPVGPGVQGMYLNGATRIQTTLEPLKLLQKLQRIERKLGRPKNHKRWHARIIDLDIIDYQIQSFPRSKSFPPACRTGRRKRESIIIKTKELTLPHPEAPKRPFVTAPLAEIT